MDRNNTTDSIGTVSFHKTEKRKLSLKYLFKILSAARKKQA